MSDPRIRTATEDDWPRIWPFFAAIVEEGQTYAYPEDLTSEHARELWMGRPPGHTVVLEDGARTPGSATMGPNRPGRTVTGRRRSRSRAGAPPGSPGRAPRRRAG